MNAKYVNPFTDFGFKKIFGEEANKAILIDFLNALLDNDVQIKNLTFKNNEQIGQNIDAKGVVFDIFCENEIGEKFIVELQKSKQNWFKERTIYYSTFPIREQVEKGEKTYKLKAVFCIGILDFTFNDYDTVSERKEWLHVIKLKNQLGKTFYDKLTYIYLEMPNFKKSESELVSRLDKWLFFIKGLEDFQNIPQIFRNEIIFTEAFEKAEIAKLDKTQLDNYEYSMKGYMDLKSVIDTAKEEGEKIGETKGELKGVIKVAKAMKDNGISYDIIRQITGLTTQEIERL